MMRVFRHSFDGSIEASAVAIGNFDGLHRGHQLVLDRLVQEAECRGLFPLVYTFFRHPAEHLRGEAPPLLMSFSSRLRGISFWNVGGVVLSHFDERMADMEAEEFVTTELVGRLKAHLLVMGESHGLGRGRKGTPEKLCRIARKVGLEILVIPTLSHNGVNISSTELRRMILKGEMQLAREFLGKPFSLEGVVVSGSGRGEEQLQIPTANVAVPRGVISPSGVFAAWCRGDFGRRAGVVNIGNRPSFGRGDRLVEVHLLDFEGNFYGQKITLDLLAKIRAERYFSHPDKLKKQIRRDISTTLEIMQGQAQSIS